MKTEHKNICGNGWNDFKVEDIVSISYSGKEIYRRKETGKTKV